MAELLHNLDKMKKAQAELAEVIGRGNPVEESDIARLPYPWYSNTLSRKHWICNTPSPVLFGIPDPPPTSTPATNLTSATNLRRRCSSWPPFPPLSPFTLSSSPSLLPRPQLPGLGTWALIDQ
ncbi:hypothetical protein Droror1_Dr00027051, partial [Drosera rotundifolia]